MLHNAEVELKQHISWADVSVKIFNLGYETYAKHQQEKLKEKIDKIQQVKKIIYGHIPEQFREKKCILSSALEVVRDREDKDARLTKEDVRLAKVTKDDYLVDKRVWGDGEPSTHLRDAAKCFIHYLVERNKRQSWHQGQLDDYRSLTALHAIDSLSLLAQRSYCADDDYIGMLKGLYSGWQELILDPLLDSAYNPCLKSALIDGREHLAKAIQVAEAQVQECASTEYLSKMVNSSKSVHDINVAEFILNLLGKSESNQPVIYGDLTHAGWPKDSVNTLLQGMLYLYSRDEKSFTTEQKSARDGKENLRSVIELIRSLEKTSNNQNVNEFCQDVMSKLSGIEFKGTKAIYSCQDQSNVLRVSIESGLPEEVCQKSVIMLVCEVLIKATLLRQNSDTLKLVYEFGKNWGDYGVYVVTRDVLQELLPMNEKVLNELYESLVKLEEEVCKLHNKKYRNAVTPPERGKNLRKAQQIIENQTLVYKRIQTSITHLTRQANEWVIKAKTIDQKEERAKLIEAFKNLVKQCKKSKIEISQEASSRIHQIDEINEEKEHKTEIAAQSTTVTIDSEDAKRDDPDDPNVQPLKEALTTLGSNSKQIKILLHRAHASVEKEDNQLHCKQHALEKHNAKFQYENKDDLRLSEIYDQRSRLVEKRLTLFKLVSESKSHTHLIQSKAVKKDLSRFSARLDKSLKGPNMFRRVDLKKYNDTPNKRAYKDKVQQTHEELKKLSK